jgi:hypothetical protein
MNKALCVGINSYENLPDLTACETDAQNVSKLLRSHGDGNPNFGVDLQTGQVTERKLKRMIEELFSDPNDVALLYFAGHGIVTSTGGFLMTADAMAYDWGVGMSDVLLLANNSPAKSKIIILDCCHSGAISQNKLTGGNHALIGDGVSVLAASRTDEVASESNRGGLFTSLFIAALEGSAADVLGTITMGSAYAFVDQALGPWDQRPIFMTNVSSYTPIRKIRPRVPIELIRSLRQHFGSPIEEFPLDPSYEDSEIEHAKPENIATFKQLRASASWSRSAKNTCTTRR